MSLVAQLAAGYGWLREGLAAVSGFEQALISQTTVRTRAELERIIMLGTTAELAGLSLAPPDLALRLLPHFVPHVYQWRRAAQHLDDLTDGLQPGC